MDRAELLQGLAVARAAEAATAALVDEHASVIDRLEAEGHPAVISRKVLADLQQKLDIYTEYRCELERELDMLDSTYLCDKIYST